MTAAALRKIHKWIAITAGLFILIWLFSGIMMILPGAWSVARPQKPLPLVDFSTLTLAPADILRRLPPGVEVQSMDLKRIGSVIAYDVKLKHQPPQLIDAVSGEPFIITRENAEQILHSRFVIRNITHTELVTRRSINYLWGSLPAYRFVLEEDPSALYFVSVRDGEIQRTTGWTAWQQGIAMLHDFSAIRAIVANDSIRRGLLLLASLAGLGVALSGYWLAWPRRRTKQL
jgi:hypothetical protein